MLGNLLISGLSGHLNSILLDSILMKNKLIRSLISILYTFIATLGLGVMAVLPGYAADVARQDQAVITPAPPALPVEPTPKMSADQLLTEVQHRAFRFFWEKTDPKTGLTNDRAHNRGTEDDYTVASIASTGYMLSALPIAVEHKWIAKQEAYDRALVSLRFLHDKVPNVHGWYYHFLDKRTGERVWNCELSSIDTSLLVAGALTAAQYWKKTEVAQLGNALYDGLDWTWMRTNGGAAPDKKTLSMGWKPEGGFLTSNWDRYCELMLIYLLGLGAKDNPVPVSSWDAWERNVVTYAGRETLAGGPIFMHQMPQGYYNFKSQRDDQGWDYWISSQQAMEINRQFCIDHIGKRKTYTPDIWGLNANDYPDGYTAFGAPGEEDGTVSPTGAIASILFTPDIAKRAGSAMYAQYGDRTWGRYGFSNAFNVDRNWYDPDVIGIDLGMAMLAIENYRTGMIWKLIGTHPATKRAWKQAGFHSTEEPEPRPLQLPPVASPQTEN